MPTNAELQKARIENDPESLAGRINAAIRDYSAQQGTEFPSAVRDALIEMRHICDANGLDYADRDKESYSGYLEECRWHKQDGHYDDDASEVKS